MPYTGTCRTQCGCLHGASGIFQHDVYVQFQQHGQKGILFHTDTLHWSHGVCIPHSTGFVLLLYVHSRISVDQIPLGGIGVTKVRYNAAHTACAHYLCDRLLEKYNHEPWERCSSHVSANGWHDDEEIEVGGECVMGILLHVDDYAAPLGNSQQFHNGMVCVHQYGNPWVHGDPYSGDDDPLLQSVLSDVFRHEPLHGACHLHHELLDAYHLKMHH